MKRERQLDLLEQLAGLRADRAAARLARVQGLIDELENRAEALRVVPDTPFVSMADSKVRDRWDRWRRQNLAKINMHVARLNVAAQPQREARARETARAAVLAKLRDRGK